MSIQIISSNQLVCGLIITDVTASLKNLKSDKITAMGSSSITP